MPKVISIDQTLIAGHLLNNIPVETIIYDAETGLIHWQRELHGMSVGPIMSLLHDFLHPQELENWRLEGALVLRTRRVQEYVQHVAETPEGLLSSRTHAWWDSGRQGWKEQLYYTHVSPASTRRGLVMRVGIPMDPLLKLAEQYLTEQAVQDVSLNARRF